MRAKLLDKNAVRKQMYGTPTAINPLLPAPSPEQQELDEMEDQKEAGNVDNLEAMKRPGQPGNPPNNTPAQVIKQPAYEKESAGTIMPAPPRPSGSSQYMYDPSIKMHMTPIAVPPNKEQGLRASLLNRKKAVIHPPATQRDPREESAARKKANNELAILSRKYHHSMPIQEIKEILQKHGFDPAAMDGIYTGEDGKMHEQTGPRTWIAMTWHKLPRTGLWEIVAYLS